VCKAIKQETDIKVCGVDKNCGQAVLDRSDYEKEGIRQLSDIITYLRLSSTPTCESILQPLRQILDKYKDAIVKQLPVSFKSLHQFLLQTADSKLKLSRFYLLLKVH
jgi:hypothetical protein